MRCPKCGSLEDKVIDSRPSKDGESIRRRRECLDCEARFTTYEEVEKLDLHAIKRDGRHEPLDRHKLKGSFIKACEKRPIGIDAIELCVEEIIAELVAEQQREVSTRTIGAKVMDKLHALDPVAYVRYASVYRSFKDVGEFIEEVQNMERRGLARAGDQPELFKS